jgi:hypothetical protein
MKFVKSVFAKLLSLSIFIFCQSFCQFECVRKSSSQRTGLGDVAVFENRQPVTAAE